MCLAVVALDAHPRYAMVLAANRDEYYARDASPLAWWNEGETPDILAGRDLTAGGTWLGVASTGRWAFVTNVREPGRHDAEAPSRGALVPRVLRHADSVASAIEAIEAEPARYNGYNVSAGEASTAFWYSNRGGPMQALGSGVHGISNAQLDTAWPKVRRIRTGVSAWIASGTDNIEALLDILSDRGIAPDHELPSTGVSLEWERALSAPFIVTERYGTRCSSVITITRAGEVRFHERSFDATGTRRGDTSERFEISSA